MHCGGIPHFRALGSSWAQGMNLSSAAVRLAVGSSRHTSVVVPRTAEFELRNKLSNSSSVSVWRSKARVASSKNGPENLPAVAASIERYSLRKVLPG